MRAFDSAHSYRHMTATAECDQVTENISGLPITVEISEVNEMMHMQNFVLVPTDATDVLVPCQGFLSLLFPIVAIIQWILETWARAATFWRAIAPRWTQGNKFLTALGTGARFLLPRLSVAGITCHAAIFRLVGMVSCESLATAGTDQGDGDSVIFPVAIERAVVLFRDRLLERPTANWTFLAHAFPGPFALPRTGIGTESSSFGLTFLDVKSIAAHLAIQRNGRVDFSAGHGTELLRFTFWREFLVAVLALFGLVSNVVQEAIFATVFRFLGKFLSTMGTYLGRWAMFALRLIRAASRAVFPCFSSTVFGLEFFAAELARFINSFGGLFSALDRTIFLVGDADECRVAPETNLGLRTVTRSTYSRAVARICGWLATVKAVYRHWFLGEAIAPMGAESLARIEGLFAVFTNSHLQHLLSCRFLGKWGSGPGKPRCQQGATLF